MQNMAKKRPLRIIRWSIPVLSVLLCLCFRFSHFRWQLVACVLCAAVSILLFRPRRGLIRQNAIAVVVFLLLLLPLIFYLITGYGMTRTRYQHHDLDRNVYRGKKILVMAPHQDDDINLFGGLYETFEEGSEVYVMFYTNGDLNTRAEVRIQEAVNGLNIMGIERDHIIFLGYGDTSENAAGVHLYNMSEGEIAMPSWGHTETYAAAGFEPYRHSPYTRASVIGDIQALLLDLQPDVIFCIDYDSHRDHRALSLFFEEAMGNILRREGNSYTPIVFKGFGYPTAYWGAFDFYAENIRSTVPYSELHPYPGDFFTDALGEQHFYIQENNTCLWEERIRFPVAENNLSRTLHASTLYDAMVCHVSQDSLYSAYESLSGIINGDKVFWPRRTSSILYPAAISTSSGDGNVLTDFKLIDSSDVKNFKLLPYENLWSPDAEDEQKTVTFSFDEAIAIDSILLYDNPSFNDNILKARVLFSDGSLLECGPLMPNGSATTLQFEKKEITSFSIQILESEGEQPGLTEVEAYFQNNPSDYIPEIIKLQDENGNFVYDYWIGDSPVVFSVYNSLEGDDTIDPQEYMLKAVTGNCEITQNEDHTFTVSCGRGNSTELALYAEGQNEPLDLVTVRNPTVFDRWWNALLVTIERIPGYHTPGEQCAWLRLIFLDYAGKLGLPV